MTKNKKWIFGGITSAIFICALGGFLNRSQFTTSLKPENEKLVLNESNSAQNIGSKQLHNWHQPMSIPGDKVVVNDAVTLTLLGVVGGDNGTGFALIEVAGRSAQHFSKGEKVSANYIIQSIGVEQVGLAEGLGQPATKILHLKQKVLIDSGQPVGAVHARIATATSSVANLTGSVQQMRSIEPPPRQDSRYKPSGPSRRHDVSFYKAN